MRIDNDMLSRSVNGQASLRTYQWSEPTVSLGYFQARQSAMLPERFAQLPVVERLSGGGAILHDREVTYSLAIPKDHPLAMNPVQLYDIAHHAILQTLEVEYGISASLRGDAAFEDQSFLCFLRGDQRDIVIENHKIVGSAQRRRQGAVLQHGSLLLAASTHAPELPGVLEITGTAIDPVTFAAQLRSKLLTSLGLSPIADS